MVCDGSGGTTSQALDSDLPVDDGIECTAEVCTSGTPGHENEPVDTACGSGQFCDGDGACVECNDGSQCASEVCTSHVCADPTCSDGVENGDETGVDCGGATCAACVPATIQATSPADGATDVSATTSIAITFSDPVDAATLSAQTAPGTCSGTLQVSSDDFATCIGFAAAAPTMSAGDTVATLAPKASLSNGLTYKVKVTGALDGNGTPIVTVTSATGFTTVVHQPVAPACNDGTVVISQVYGAGGNNGATYKNDFIELHNRGTVPVSLDGWSVQYASASGSTWNNATPLSGTIPAGGYFLIQEAGGATGAVLPTADLTGNIGMSATTGKVALVRSTTQLSGVCPLGGAVVDFVGFGTANCFEGADAAPAPSASNSVQRKGAGCLDAGENTSDFEALAAAPRNAATASLECNACDAGLTVNETDASVEADYCVLQSPNTDMSLATGATSATIYGRIYEAGVTPAGGLDADVVAQLGYGPASANPENQSGWVWTDATYNTAYGNDDEYQATIVAPAAGSYRYAYRFSVDGGSTWTYCDANGSGSNAGLSFEMAHVPALTVTP
jgi:hypothetical protein